MRLRRFELAGDARRTLALELHQTFQHLPLACGFRERQHEQHAEDDHEPDGGRRGVEEQPLGAKGERMPTRRARDDTSDSSAAPRFAAFQRGVA